MIEYNDYELIMLYHEKNEDAEIILFKQYQKIIIYLLSKYKFVLRKIGIDYQELYDECLTTFNEAIKKYNPSNNASFNTFANLIIKRKINHIILKNNKTYKIYINNPISINEKSLIEIIKSNEKDPLYKIIEQNNIENINNKIMECLSTNELDVYNLLVNNISYNEMMIILNKSYKQITNTVDRIRKKLKEKLLEFY